MFGPGLTGASAATSEDEIRSSISSFSKVLRVVEENFADKLGPEKTLYKGAIPGMLRTLDPHSNFLDPKDFAAMRDDQRGHYYGVGMQIQPRNGKIYVMAPFNGSPAYKAGIRPGDTILEVNDKKTDNLTSSEVADLLKGPRGTPVQIVIGREGMDKPLTFNLQRGEISRKSVEDAFFVKPGIAYVDVQQFNENTSREMKDTLKKIGESNLQGLILDLRSNPGGLLNEGVAVAGHFLQNGQTVVSHRGRASAEKPYFARPENKVNYPIVVLVDRYSASASEIVSGALQDHDRGWILGDNTFGKGLVQTVYPLSDSTALALTTARYYTPSDRSIQRDYKSTSFFDYYYRKNTNTQDKSDAKMTDSGRTVYGGGGISPDEKFTPEKLNKFQTELLRKYSFQGFTTRYFAQHDPKLPKDWQADDAILNEFRAYMTAQKIEGTDADFAANKPWTQNWLTREMVMTAFGVEESRRVEIMADPMVLKAVDSMPKAQALLDTARKTIVQRMGR